MNRFCAAAAASLLTFSLAAPAWACMPPPYHTDFRKHPADVYAGERKAVDFASDPAGAQLSDADKQRIRVEAAQGPNFAGAYRIVEVRCGENCMKVLVVSLATGKIHRVPVEGQVWVMHRINSKFLVIRPKTGDTRAVKLFVFDGEQFRPASAES